MVNNPHTTSLQHILHYRLGEATLLLEPPAGLAIGGSIGADFQTELRAAFPQINWSQSNLVGDRDQILLEHGVNGNRVIQTLNLESRSEVGRLRANGANEGQTNAARVEAIRDVEKAVSA